MNLMQITFTLSPCPFRMNCEFLVGQACTTYFFFKCVLLTELFHVLSTFRRRWTLSKSATSVREIMQVVNYMCLMQLTLLAPFVLLSFTHAGCNISPPAPLVSSCELVVGQVCATYFRLQLCTCLITYAQPTEVAEPERDQRHILGNIRAYANYISSPLLITVSVPMHIT